MGRKKNCFGSSSSSSCSSSSSSCKESSSSSSSSTKYICKKKSRSCKSLSCSAVSKDCCPPEILACKFGPAVVTVQGQYSLTTAFPPTVPDPSTLAYFSTCGNGALLKNRVVACPSRLVLIPPTQLGTANRYPYVTKNVTAPTGNIPNTMTAVARVLVTVNNVNNRKHSFAYQARILGVDGAGGLAFLRIMDRCEEYNRAQPVIKKCHPYFVWGCSNKLKRGETVYALGDLGFNRNFPRTLSGSNMIAKGVVCDATHTDHSGWILPQLLVVDINVPTYHTGLPIIDCEGYLVGITVTSRCTSVPPVSVLNPAVSTGDVTQYNGWGATQAVSSFFARRVAKAILCGCRGKYKKHLQSITDGSDSYYRYVKGYLGISYVVVDAEVWSTTLVQTGLPTFLVRQLRYAGPVPASSPRCKEIMGIQITAFAGQNAPFGVQGATGYFIPGATTGTLYTGFQGGYVDSPLLNTEIQQGDIISHINRCAIGDLYRQYTPSLFTWREAEASSTGSLCNIPLRLTYRPASRNWTTSEEVTVNVADYPPLMDYPWFAIGDGNLAVIDSLPSLNFTPAL